MSEEGSSLISARSGGGQVVRRREVQRGVGRREYPSALSQIKPSKPNNEANTTEKSTTDEANDRGFPFPPSWIF